MSSVVFTDSLSKRRYEPLYRALETAIRESRSAVVVGPVLEIVEVLDAQAYDAALTELPRLLETLDDETGRSLTREQCARLEALVIGEKNSQLTILGLLALGSAGWQAQELRTVRSWAACPDRRGAAAREYLSALGSAVG